MKQYLELLREVKEKGTHKPAAREGLPGSLSLFGAQFRHNLQEGFPLLTSKKMFWKGIVVELLWFLKGDVNIKYLLDNDVHIWDEDAYNYYLKKGHSAMNFKEFIQNIKDGNGGGDCGYQYGKTWRNWESHTEYPDGTIRDIICIDQIANLIDGLKNTPESRRHIVTSVDPAHSEDLALFWCHAMFQMNCRPLSGLERWSLQSRYQRAGAYHNIDLEDSQLYSKLDTMGIPNYKLDCHMQSRSADAFLGVPFNIASYALLTHIIANICNMIPGELIISFGDLHIYDNHMKQVDEQLKREPKILPSIWIDPDVEWINKDGSYNFDLEWREDSGKGELTTLSLHDYQFHPPIEGKLSTGLK